MVAGLHMSPVLKLVKQKLNKERHLKSRLSVQYINVKVINVIHDTDIVFLTLPMRNEKVLHFCLFLEKNQTLIQ